MEAGATDKDKAEAVAAPIETPERKGITVSNDGLRSALEIMGVEEYDPLVISALAEYARRITTDLLCDAKDISMHSGKTEIDGSDMKLAINLCDRKLVDSASQAKRAIDIADEINAQPLGDIPDYAVRKIPDMTHSLLKRGFTYVPGDEAYPETVKRPALSTEEKTGLNGSSVSGIAGGSSVGGVKKGGSAKRIINIAPRLKASVDMNKTFSI